MKQQEKNLKKLCGAHHNRCIQICLICTDFPEVERGIGRREVGVEGKGAAPAGGRGHMQKEYNKSGKFIPILLPFLKCPRKKTISCM